MRIVVSRLVPPAQAVVVHASLGEVEWPGALEHAQAGAARSGMAFVVARARKTFFELVEHRYGLGVVAWPTAQNRQCTSDLKRDPIMREVRRIARARGTSLIVTCMGLRAQANPALFARYVAMEERTGFRMHASRLPLAELVADPKVPA